MRTVLAALAAAVTGLALLPATALPAHADGGFPNPKTPPRFARPIEPLAAYDPQSTCSPAARPGAVYLGNLAVATYGGRYTVGRVCGTDGAVSEHYEGRAIDYFKSTRIPSEARQANTFIHWMLYPDAQGNPYGYARRLGVMYIIWNGYIWGSYRAGDGWRPYGNCLVTVGPAYDTSCHRNHIHISMSRAGGAGRTSYWSAIW
jgi:hypothetical protein